jgi:quercetin dioxygenase-like cupin family protein
MPVELRRFGVGHRRPDGPPGTRGVTAQVIEGGQLGFIAELAFDRHARTAPHANPNWTYFLVIEGGGWVGVGEDRTRVQAGEAAVWPPDVIHAAWTDGAPMRAIVVELFPPRVALPSTVDGIAPPEGSRHVERGEGELAPRPYDPEHDDPTDAEGEPR